MHWYISFLRPPPVSITLTTEEITITPQVANDLRTELRYDPTPLQYIWQRLTPSLSPPTPARELTTFIPPQSTYKPISVPLPAGVQIGESWRLGLFSPSPSTSSSRHPSCSLMSLCEDDVGVIGVWSEGIDIVRSDLSNKGAVRGINGSSKNGKDKEKESKKGKGKEKDDGPKQGRITREFTLPLQAQEDGEEGESREEMLRIIEQTSFDLDKKIWDSGLALSSWFWKYLPYYTRNESTSHPDELVNGVFDLLRRQDGLDILEIGSGTGLVSIALSLAIKRYLPEVKRNIIATDLDTAIPLMNENLKFNCIDIKSNSNGNNVNVRADVLDWDKPLPSWVSVDDHLPELVIAADVTYNTSAFPSLLQTLISLLTPSSDRIPILVLAYKQRDPSERDLWKMLNDNGIKMTLVDKVVGSEIDQGETEIWIGRMKS
ncbi:uncharacterized protein L199_002986 [Kwoniella botswanensis]|uniref:uncharacterized protein n=1 Tax=Kwoniella botswanensis TaxID=1268659 RepID=UPI00315D1A85